MNHPRLFGCAERFAVDHSVIATENKSAKNFNQIFMIAFSRA